MSDDGPPPPVAIPQPPPMTGKPGSIHRLGSGSFSDRQVSNAPKSATLTMTGKPGMGTCPTLCDEDCEAESVALFAIDPVWTWHRYLLTGGRIMDVRSPYASNSTERDLVLQEAKRLWGGKKDDWKIEGVTRLERDDG